MVISIARKAVNLKEFHGRDWKCCDFISLSCQLGANKNNWGVITAGILGPNNAFLRSSEFTYLEWGQGAS